MKNLRNKLLGLTLSGALALGSCDLFLPPITPPNTGEETEEVEEDDEEDSEEEYIQRGDLSVSINPEGSYRVGDNLNLSGKIQNARQSPIYFDNVSGTSLEYNLMNESGVVENQVFDTPFHLTLKKAGYLEVEHKDDKLSIKGSNVEANYDGKHYDVPAPIEFTIKEDLPSYIFQESGKHWLEFIATYKFEDVEYRAKFKSIDFLVNE